MLCVFSRIEILCTNFTMSKCYIDCLLCHLLLNCFIWWKQSDTYTNSQDMVPNCAVVMTNTQRLYNMKYHDKACYLIYKSYNFSCSTVQHLHVVFCIWLIQSSYIIYNDNNVYCEGHIPSIFASIANRKEII